jgi:thymidylate kinase
MHAKWIVIEGDNGVGKDALASKLAEHGWLIATNDPEAVSARSLAMKSSGQDRVIALLRYERRCAAWAQAQVASLLVRYWPSTLAAASADRLLPPERVGRLVHWATANMPRPALFIELTAELPERVRRVETRGRRPGAVDDVSVARDLRYRRAMQNIAGTAGVWERIDTTHLTAEEVFQTAIRFLGD